MTVEDLDAELRPYGWHAWKSRGAAWPVTSLMWQDGIFYACRWGTTEWAATAEELRRKVMRRVRGLRPVSGGAR